MRSRSWQVVAAVALGLAIGCGGGGSGGRSSAGTTSGVSSGSATTGSGSLGVGPITSGGGPGGGSGSGGAVALSAAAGPRNPGAASVAAGAELVGLQLRLIASGADVRLEELALSLSGTARLGADADQFRLVVDTAGDGAFDPVRDPVLATTNGAGTGRTFARGSFPAQPVTVAAPLDLLVLVRFNAAAAVGATLQVGVDGAALVARDPAGLAVSAQGLAQGALLTVRGASLPDSWAARASLLSPRVDAGAAGAAATGLLHLVGGSVAGQPVGVHEAYDPRTDRWQSLTPLSVARARLGLAELGGRLYAVGGVDAAGLTRTTVEVYDPATLTWSLGPALPGALAGCSALVLGNELWVVGGSDGSAPFRLSYLFDPQQNAWRVGPYAGLPGPAAAAGGYVVGFEVPSQIYWGPGQPGSTIVQPGAFGQSASVLWDWPDQGGAAALGARAYLVAGRRNGAPVAELQSVEAGLIYAGGDVRRHRALLTARARPAVAALGGKLYAAGGVDAAGVPLTAFEEYTP